MTSTIPYGKHYSVWQALFRMASSIPALYFLIIVTGVVLLYSPVDSLIPSVTWVTVVMMSPASLLESPPNILMESTFM